MGIFDKWKKKVKNEKESSKGEKQAVNDNRRFTFLVEDTFQLKENLGIVVVGNVHGTVRVHDAVYIMQPGSAITLAEISGLEIPQKGRVEEAKNEPVSIWLTDIKDKNTISKFSVFTSIRPQTVVDVESAVENPYVLGLSLEYRRFCNEADYLNLLIYEIAHGHYITPVYMSKEPERQADGSCVMREGATMGFLSLKDPQDETKDVFPIFTDWNALSKWENVFNEEHPPKTVILRFQDCVSFVQKNDSGMVINPYGPTPVFLSADMIKKITNLEGYKAEFSEEKQAHVEEKRVEKDTKIMVGLPKETSEVLLIKDALISCAKHISFIKRVDLLLKIEENNEKAYLCVVDCQEEKCQKVFEELYAAIKPFANETKLVDFITYDRAQFVKDILEKNNPVYIKERKN